jgi:GT2 family glycosyltransferase
MRPIHFVMQGTKRNSMQHEGSLAFGTPTAPSSELRNTDPGHFPDCPSPLVTVIVVTYDSARHLPDLIHSLRAQTLRDFEVLQIDSRSTDRSSAIFASHWPGLRSVLATENLGYRRGNQLGMEMARGKYVVVLNDDVELHPCLLEQLVRRAESDEHIAVVAPAILIHGSADRLNAAGSDLLPSGFYAARGKNEPYQHFREMRDIAAASGCCFLLRRSFLANWGGFDPLFDSLPSGWHASAEDLDLCWKAWVSGYRVVYEPTALLWHKYTQKPLNESRLASLTAGRVAFVLMNFAPATLWRFAPVMLLTELALVAWGILRGPAYLRTWVLAWRWAWRNRHRLRELRATRESRRQRSDRNLLPLLRPSISLAPELRRSPVALLAAMICFGLNAACLAWRPGERL